MAFDAKHCGLEASMHMRGMPNEDSLSKFATGLFGSSRTYCRVLLKDVVTLHDCLVRFKAWAQHLRQGRCQTTDTPV